MGKEQIKASCARAERWGTFCDLEKRGMATKRAGGAKGVKKETVKPLITQARIQKRIREMGRQIRKDFPDDPILLLGVLKGAVPFLADLARQIPGEVTFDFIAVSSYGKEAHSTVRAKPDKGLASSRGGEYGFVV